MLTALATTLLAVATAAPQPPAQTRPVAAPVAATTLATVLPPPGAWALMGMGCVALIRARRTKK